MCMFDTPEIPEPKAPPKPTKMTTPADVGHDQLKAKRKGTSSLKVDLDIPEVENGLFIP